MGQWTTPQVKKFAATAPLSQFASMLTTHFYVMKSTTPNATTASFLSETGVRMKVEGCNLLLLGRV